MQSEGNAPKNGETILDYSFTTMLQRNRRFGKGFLSKEQYDKTGASPILSSPGAN
jgi:hypothetical protein